MLLKTQIKRSGLPGVASIPPKYYISNIKSRIMRKVKSVFVCLEGGLIPIQEKAFRKADSKEEMTLQSLEINRIWLNFIRTE